MYRLKSVQVRLTRPRLNTWLPWYMHCLLIWSSLARCDTVTYQGGVVLAGKVLHGLQPLERNKDEYIQIELDPGGRELVSSCGKIKSFTRSQSTYTKTSRKINS